MNTREYIAALVEHRSRVPADAVNAADVARIARIVRGVRIPQPTPPTPGVSTAVAYVQNAVANPAVRNLGILGGVVLAGSFALCVYNVYMRYNSSRSKRRRQVN